MRKDFILDRILQREKSLQIVKQLLNCIDETLYYFDDFTDEIFSDVFYCLYIEEQPYTYLDISNLYSISSNKILKIKLMIDEYTRKLINTNGEYACLKKYF